MSPLLLLALASCSAGSPAPPPPARDAPAPSPPAPARQAPEPAAQEHAMTLEIGSPAFQHMGGIPRRYTCQGEDIPPALEWSGLPPGTRSLALVVDDPDAPDPANPRMTWVHWVLYDIPAHSTGLPEGGSPLPPGTLEGTNDWKRTGWGGPCPPIGRHRYFFKLHALDVVLPDLGSPTKAALLRAMEGHVLARAELVGTYRKG